MPHEIAKSGEHIIGFRTSIAHGYDMVADDLVWDVIVNHLPTLRAEVEAMKSSDWTDR